MDINKLYLIPFVYSLYLWFREANFQNIKKIICQKPVFKITPLHCDLSLKSKSTKIKLQISLEFIPGAPKVLENRYNNFINLVNVEQWNLSVLSLVLVPTLWHTFYSHLRHCIVKPKSFKMNSTKASMSTMSLPPPLDAPPALLGAMTEKCFKTLETIPKMKR